MLINCINLWQQPLILIALLSNGFWGILKGPLLMVFLCTKCKPFLNCVFLGENLVSWKSRKKKVVSRSNTVVEYISLAFVTTELIWVKFLLKESCISILHPPLTLCCNISAQNLAQNPVFYAHTKHIKIDHHFMRDQVVQSQLLFKHIRIR